MEAEGVIVGTILLVLIAFFLAIRFLRGRAIQRARWLLKQENPNLEMLDLTIKELAQIRSFEAKALRQALLGIQKRQKEANATLGVVTDSQTPRQPDI